MNAAAIRSGIKSGMKVLGKHSPAIAAGIGIVSIVSTAIFAAKPTPKVHKKLAEGKKRMEELKPAIQKGDLDAKEESREIRKEMAITIAKSYWPAVASGTIGIASIIFSHRTHVRRNMALASAYALTLNEYKSFREKAKEMKYLSSEKEHKIDDEIAKDRLTKMVSTPPCNQPSPGDELFFDSWSGRKFYSTINKIESGVNNFNFNMINEMSKPMNDLYFELDLDEVDCGQLEFYADQGPIEATYGSIFVPADGKSYTVVKYDRHPT